MKNPLRSILFLAALFSALLALVLVAVPNVNAQADSSLNSQLSSLNSAAVETAAAVAQPFIVGFAQKHPWLLTVLAAIATLRLVFKPIMSAVEAYVKSTPSTGDDEFVARARHSPAFKAFAWLLDYLGSIKVGPQRAKAEGLNP